MGTSGRILATGKPFVIFYGVKSVYLIMFISTKRLTSLREQKHFMHHLPGYSEILSMSKSHSQME